MAVGWSDNCYSYNDFKVTTNSALTNTPHSAAMQAPGCMQSILASEVVIEHVARTVGKSVQEVQELNFYDPSAGPVVTPFGDHIGVDGYNWTIPTLWKNVQEQADLTARRAAVRAYNAANRYTKKGIAISPAKCT
jgi:xanthine dehydrogenase molybdopterin-binding subunit B